MPAMQNCTASLSIYGDDLDTSEITRMLACEPTSSEHKGQEIPGHKGHVRVARTGAWHLESALPRSSDLEEHISALLDKTTADPEAWRFIASRFSARIFCGLFMEVWNEGFILSPGLMKRLAERGLRAEFDIYGKPG